MKSIPLNTKNQIFGQTESTSRPTCSTQNRIDLCSNIYIVLIYLIILILVQCHSFEQTLRFEREFICTEMNFTEIIQKSHMGAIDENKIMQKKKKHPLCLIWRVL